MAEENTIEPEAVTPSPSSKLKVKTGFSLALLMILGIAVFYFLNFKTVVVSGQSMEPTFFSGRRLLASSAYWLIGGLKRNDIVVIKSEDSHEYIIKRLYRLEGEKVDWLNVPDDWSLTRGEYVVPKGHVFVLGDNRAVSEDSRKFGAVRLERVIGKVVIR